MPLGGALQIGNSALVAHQAAIEAAGNNLANLATSGYHRQKVDLVPHRSTEFQSGLFIGRGVQINAITRQVDNALEGRIRASISDQAYSLARKEVLTQIEALQNEYSEADLSSRLDAFLHAWSELSTPDPQDHALRTLVIREGSQLADFAKGLHGGLAQQRTQVDNSIDAAAIVADDLLTQIAAVDHQIMKANPMGDGAPTLRDRRDVMLAELGEYVDVSVHEHPSGSMDVFIGSMPVILNGESRGIRVERLNIDGEMNVRLVVKDNGTALFPTSGRIGSLMDVRQRDVNFAIDNLDAFINELIFQVNKIHSQGQGLSGWDSVTSTNRVLDPTFALNDAASGLGFTPEHGSFQLHVREKSTGEIRSSTIQVDLDGIDAGNDARLGTLQAAISAVGNVTASVTPDGRLTIAAEGSGSDISFSEDSSGVLAALGINTFFEGSGGSNIAVNQLVAQSPGLVAASQDHTVGNNHNALTMVELGKQQLDAFNGLTFQQSWARRVEDFALRINQVNEQLESDTIVTASLRAQQQSVSGVNTDEELINLLAFQRAYQGSARFLQVVDELLETLVSLV